MPTFDDVRAIALSLPEAEEILTWEWTSPSASARRSSRWAGRGASRYRSRRRRRPQAEPIDLDPRTFRPSAYVGRYGWVTADLRRIDPGLLQTLLVEAWRLTAPKRLAAMVANLRS